MPAIEFVYQIWVFPKVGFIPTWSFLFDSFEPEPCANACDFHSFAGGLLFRGPTLLQSKLIFIVLGWNSLECALRCVGYNGAVLWFLPTASP